MTSENTTVVQQFLGKGQCVLCPYRLNVLVCSHPTEKWVFVIKLLNVSTDKIVFTCSCYCCEGVVEACNDVFC